MCIVALAWQLIDENPICLLSNRDEFYARSASKLHAWPNSEVIAGKDLKSGGTWMGVTASGRWAIVTNFRDGNDQKSYSTSRGALIENYLQSDLPPIRFAQELEKTQLDYAGFNLFLGDKLQAVYMSNRGEAPQLLAKGVYVLSNGLMSEHWEKTKHLRTRFTQEFLPLLQKGQEAELEYAAWDILEDSRKVATERLPHTGISQEMEKLLSSTFIESPVYGTRCSNFLIMHKQNWRWGEKTQHGEGVGEITWLDVQLK